jgi:branched-subunit amino acid transport protein
MSTFETIITIVGLTALTVITRGFFFLSRREMSLPDWLQAGLRYAPLAALVAVVVPQVFMPGGHWQLHALSPQIWGAVAGGAWFFWRRGILGTIVVGMAVFTALRLAMPQV